MVDKGDDENFKSLGLARNPSQYVCVGLICM
jgi:hypothetical protein